MKVNKITIFACAIAIIISGIAIFLLPSTKPFATTQNIATGVFTSSIVSCVIALVNYLHERNLIVERIDNNIKNLYLNMSLMFSASKNMFPQIEGNSYFPDSFYNYILMLSGKNVECLNDMKLGQFNPFFKETKLYNVCIQLSRFEDITYNFKNNVGNLLNQEMECNYRFSLYNNTQPNNSTPIIYPPELISLRKQIVTDTAKLQEFVWVKLIDLENISADFYDRKSSKHCWNTIKSNLLSQIEDIIKGK